MNLKNKNHKIISLVSSIFILVFIFLLSQTDISKTIAQTSNPKLSGYAWSDTTGWIHFATTTGAQNIVEIGTDGYLNGFAWSENIGWIKFGDLAGQDIITYIENEIGEVWVERTSAGARKWYGITSSSDVKKIAAIVNGGYIYTSTDSGVTWTPRMTDTNRNWRAITSSSDGTKLTAAMTGGYIYTSTDSGVTWTPRMTDANRGWISVTSSSDGVKLVAVVNGGYIYTSTDSGVTWTPRMTDASRDWFSITSSSDGTKLAAVVGNVNITGDEHIYTSTDSGVTWTERSGPGSRYWVSINSSSDGTKLTALAYGNYIYTSTDSGVTWTPRMTDANRNWASVTSSSDGTKRVAVTYAGGYIYTSTDSGVTWTQRVGSGGRYWISITSSSDGTKLASLVDINGYIYTSDILSSSITTSTNAKLENNELTGWARACAGTINGDCTGGNRTDGWDGWISLSGSGYGVKVDGTSPSFAWGSDVIGWIDFSGVTSQSSIVNGVCRTYSGDAPQLPSLPGVADLCISGTASTPTEQRINHLPVDNENPYDYVYTWDCNGNGGTDDLGCSVTTDLQRSSGLGPVAISARLNPSIVNTGGKCVVSIVESPEVLNEINASSTCAVYLDSNPLPATPYVPGNPASSNSIDRPNVDPGYDYKVVCKDNANTQTFISKTLKCLLNPKVKEI